MKLEQQVVSLELAKKLKELGVKQESYFIWTNPSRGKLKVERNVVKYHNMDMVLCSAYTVAELGKMLPSHAYSIKTSKGKHISRWWGEATEHKILREHKVTQGYTTPEQDTEADARAKCLIHLIENGLLEVYEKVSIPSDTHSSNNSLGKAK